MRDEPFRGILTVPLAIDPAGRLEHSRSKELNHEIGTSKGNYLVLIGNCAKVVGICHPWIYSLQVFHEPTRLFSVLGRHMSEGRHVDVVVGIVHDADSDKPARVWRLTVCHIDRSNLSHRRIPRIGVLSCARTYYVFLSFSNADHVSANST